MNTRRLIGYILLPLLVVLLTSITISLGAVSTGGGAFPPITTPTSDITPFALGSTSGADCWSALSFLPTTTAVRRFTDIAGTKAQDIWAVGYWEQGNYALDTLALHWDGVQWRLIPTPGGGGQGSRLNAITALAPHDAWAVGYWVENYRNPGIGDRVHSLILHWNGTQWYTVPNPGNSYLRDVTAIAPNDVWAVGDAPAGIHGTGVMQALHWDGAAWHDTPLPSPSSGTYLHSVTALAPDDVWAVGTQILRWNGSGWRAVATPLGPGDTLYSVSSVDKNDLWAVGSGYSAATGGYQTLVLHWDGNQWRPVPSPNPAAARHYSYLQAVTFQSSTDGWAIGYYNTDFGPQPLILSWNGMGWNPITDRLPITDGTLQALTLLQGDLWAVGTTSNAPAESLIIHRTNAPCASP